MEQGACAREEFRLGQGLTGSRACPHCSGPACRVSGAPCYSEIPYSFAWNRKVPVTVRGHEEACKGLGNGEAVYLQRRLTRSAPLFASPLGRQEALLAAISEKDANIALLELSASKKKKTQDEVALLKREKDRLVQQLKQQVGHMTVWVT
ncbi:hypothetical protein AALO_G00218350 [Alosa alosa]|uniref:Uncharacterized protein n=1 Tax=Alosa alosa TaxID=278164 RepID=A0AAV6G3H0_9TELE|nr:hypothetical protein AALO_G00218350 [Alosa alosa]